LKGDLIQRHTETLTAFGRHFQTLGSLVLGSPNCKSPVCNPAE
jgi:hypothetical protein